MEPSSTTIASQSVKYLGKFLMISSNTTGNPSSSLNAGITIDRLTGNMKVLYAKERAIALYAGNLWESFLSKFKFWEEPYEVVNAMLPSRGIITELGCGEGLLANYLALASPKRKIVGIEIVPQRLAIAKKGLKNTTYYVGDIVNVPFPKSNAIIVFHVLHLLPGKHAQELVLQKAKNSLKIGGGLIIVDVHVKP